MKKQPSGGWSARDLKASFVAEKSKEIENASKEA